MDGKRFKCSNWLDDRLAFDSLGNVVSLEKTLSPIDGGVFFRLGCSMRALARPTMAVISEIRAVSNFNISMSSDMGTTSLLWEALFGTKVAVELVPNIQRSY